MTEQHTEFPAQKYECVPRSKVSELPVQKTLGIPMIFYMEWFGTYILHSECSIELH